MALGIQRLLRRVTCSEIYAHHIAPEYAGRVRPLWSYESRHARSVLIFHASIGQPEVFTFLAGRAEPLVLVYHNITPSQYFEQHDAGIAELLALGRRELEIVRPRVVGAVAASEYNAHELELIGYRDVRVVPPLVDVRRLSGVEPRPAMIDRLRAYDGPVLLSVAQLMPHKRPDFLVEAMHCAQTYGSGRAPVLLLVGAHRLLHYMHAVREQVRELAVNVHLVGAVDDADLAALYQGADLVVTASEHEGFCLPLLEAMTFDTPVVARAWAAVPETVGDAALLVPPAEGPAFFAEAAAELLARRSLYDDLVARGRRRVTEFERGAPDAAILDALLEAV